jgi:predicted dehydrogenase
MTRVGQLRVGIVGCGSIARAHLGAYQAVDDVEVTAVYDVSREAAEALAADASPSTRVTTSVGDMISGGVDAVSVCTPPGVHLENCLPFVEAGIPVLCEKPLEKSVARAEAIAEAVGQSRAPFMVAFCHRFHPPVIELKALIDRGTLGRPIFFSNIFSGWMDLAPDHRSKPELSGGGTMIDTCSHSVDLFRYLVAEPTEVIAVTANVVQDLLVEDLAAVILSTGDRSIGQIAASHSLAVGSNTLAWYGSEGTGVIDYWNRISYTLRGEEPVHCDCAPRPDRFEREISHFVTCIREGVSPSVTVEDGLYASRIVAAAYKSAATGRAVSLPAAVGSEE